MILKTKRLILRDVTINDSKDIFEYMGDKENTKYMYFGSYKTIDEVKTFIENYLNNEELKAHMFVVELDNKVIGDVSIYDEDDYAELAWVFNKEYHNKGYAFEAVTRYIEFITNEYNYKYLLARADIRNNPSIKLMNKLNMRYILKEIREYPDGRPNSEEVEYRLDLNKGEK